MIVEAARNLKLFKDLVCVAVDIRRYVEFVGALWSHQALALNDEFVPLGFTAEDRVIVEDEACPARPACVLEVQGGSETTHSTTNDDEIEDFTGIFGG